MGDEEQIDFIIAYSAFLYLSKKKSLKINHTYLSLFNFFPSIVPIVENSYPFLYIAY